MVVRIELLEDAIFGSGISVPGSEDSSIVYDDKGFPYLRGTTFRGVLKEEVNNYINWKKDSDKPIDEGYLEKLFGKPGMELETKGLIYVSDFRIHDSVKESITGNTDEVLNALTCLRTFTALENGLAKKGSLRTVRCIRRGLVFYGNIACSDEDTECLKEILGYVKWIGSMRTRGFGKVKVTVVGGE